MKEVGRLWQVITKQELQRFQVQSSIDQARYDEEQKAYLNLMKQKQKGNL